MSDDYDDEPKKLQLNSAAGILAKLFRRIQMDCDMTPDLFRRKVEEAVKRHNAEVERTGSGRKTTVSAMTKKLMQPAMTWKTFLTDGLFGLLNISKFTLRLELTHENGNKTTTELKLVNPTFYKNEFVRIQRELDAKRDKYREQIKKLEEEQDE